MYLRLLILTLMLVLWPTSRAVCQSLREAAKADGHATTSVHVWQPVKTIPDMFTRADLVIHGIIADVKVHLTPDESNVVTDYTLSAMRVLKQDPMASTAKVPGRTRPLIVRCLGGTVVEGSARYTTYTNLYSPTDAFETGEHVVLFLSYDEEEKVYLLSHGPYGAFRVTAGQVRAMTKAAAKRSGFQPRSLEPFLAELARGAK